MLILWIRIRVKVSFKFREIREVPDFEGITFAGISGGSPRRVLTQASADVAMESRL